VIHAKGPFISLLHDVALELDTSVRYAVDFALDAVVER
jgi:hypothetical protein